MWNGIGGDLFAIVYDAKSGNNGLNASAGLPRQSIERLHGKGLREMPEYGIESATVPAPSMDGRSWSIDRKRNSTNPAPAIQIAQDVSRLPNDRASLRRRKSIAPQQ